MDESIKQKIDDFFSKYNTRSYSKGQVLILNGDKSEYIYNLVEGRVKQYDVNYRGDEIILNVFKPPAFFPMSLAINNQASPFIFEAETDIKIRQADAKDAVKFLKDNPDVMFDLLSRVYRGTDGLLTRMVHLMAGSAKARLMFEILLSCKRFGDSKSDGSCTITLNESELAARAGLSRETVSREMSKLNSAKLLKLDNGKITVYSLKVFEEKLSKTV